ncbi:MAG: sugar phosphate nucleotidyltransferase [Myxococcota bacterium]|nr:sugar phosphate nucleotidyltransferase [Myxococcota bacterium]
MSANHATSDAPVLGVILAAGKGTRLMPFSVRHPKPLLPVLGRPLIEYQLEALRELGVRRVIVVIGHLGAEIVQALGDGSRFGLAIEYVEQEATLGIAHALARVEPLVDRPVMVLLGDIFFVHDGLARMLAMLDAGAAGVLAVKEESDAEAIRRNFVAIEDESGRVVRVIEKPRHPRGRLKGCGIYLFQPDVFDALRRTPRTAMRDEYELTDGIQIFIDDGYDVRAARVIREDVNVSYPKDLLELNLRLLGDGALVAPGARVAPGAVVERSVIMAGATIEHPITVRESLVFPGATVRATQDVRRAIVTLDHVIDCR